MEIDSEKELQEQLSQIYRFEPFVDYNRVKESITIFLRDCSFVERKISENVTILTASHPEKDNKLEIVGVMIRNVPDLKTYEM